jgi:subtilisin family serine protease
MDSGLTTIFDGSVDDQTIPGRDPFEIMGNGFSGERIVVVRYFGTDRALRLDTNRGRLTLATAGAVVGHNGGDGTISVAAANVSTAGGGAFTGGATNPIQTYSSDGPRRIFFNPDGSAITPGNVLFGTSGGRSLQKPDITAADCVTTTTPGFIPFCGTSAAAPHAAAIAALLKSAPNHPSTGQALAAMFATALDVTPAVGRDRDAGVGIVMANLAAGVLTSVPAIDFFTVSPCRVFDTREVGGPTAGAPLTCGSDRDFTIVGGTCGVPSGAKAVSLNVTVTEPSVQGNVRLFASGAPAPLVSTQNYVAGQTRANNAVAPLSTGGQMAVRCSSGTAHVIVDVNGYFR